MKKKRIGILGGSFDPAHNGHLAISKEAVKRFKLEKIIWAITKKNPFKIKSSLSLQSRIKGCKKIIKKNKFIAGDHVTIADFSAYVEIAQLNTQFTNLYDYSDFENLSRWLEDMSKLPYHDDVHMVLTKMGDISETVPEMEIIMKANLETFSHLNEIASRLD